MIFLKASELFSKTTRPFFLSLFFHFQNAGLTAKNIGVFDSKHRCFAPKAPMFLQTKHPRFPPLYSWAFLHYIIACKKDFTKQKTGREKKALHSQKKNILLSMSRTRKH